MNPAEEEQHIWSCRQVEGMLGEVGKFHPLTQTQVSSVIEDPAKAAEFCPDGEIVCEKCDKPLIPDGHPVKAGDFDTGQIVHKVYPTDRD